MSIISTTSLLDRLRNGRQHAMARHHLAHGAGGDLLSLQMHALERYGLPPASPRLTAHHEAGHLIVGLAMGGRFESARLMRGGIEGHVSVFVEGVHGTDFSPLDNPVRAWLLGLNLAAGLAAEVELGEFHPASSTDEQLTLFQLGAGLSRIPAAPPPHDIVGQAFSMAGRVLQANGVAWIRAASLLLAQKRLTGKQAALLPIERVDLEQLVPVWLKGVQA